MIQYDTQTEQYNWVRACDRIPDADDKVLLVNTINALLEIRV